MVWVNQDRTAIAGVGATPYYRLGESGPQTPNKLIGTAILAACEDAGINVKDIDGLVSYQGGLFGYTTHINTASIMETLGIPEMKFDAVLTGGGGGSAGAIGLAAAAIMNGDARHVIMVMGIPNQNVRLGKLAASLPMDPELSFLLPAGMIGPGYFMAPLVRRHMHLYGTRREAFAETVLSHHANAANRPGSRRRSPLTLEEYFQSPMLADPLCRLDFCLENEGAIAVLITSAERARDLRKAPVYVHACVHGGERVWGRGFIWHNMPDPTYASSGNARIGERLWEAAGVGPSDMDVALIYDHFSPLVLMQLEDFGFCERGEGGAFVESGAIRFKTGSIPVNPHGGQLAEAYMIGMTHIREAVEQLRGTAINQVKDAELALVTGGPSMLPLSALILRR